MNNEFHNGVIDMGSGYHPSSADRWTMNYFLDQGYLAFASQKSVDVENNLFNVDPIFTPPFLIHLGHFTSSTVDHNVINYNGSNNLATIIAEGGDVKWNTINIGPSTSYSVGIVINPDEGPGIPASAFDVEGNTITANSVSAGIDIANAGFTDAAPVLVQNNVLNGPGPLQVVESGASVNLSSQ